MSLSHYHISVTSDNMVTVIVTSYEVTEKSVEDPRKITSYNIYYTC